MTVRASPPRPTRRCRDELRAIFARIEAEHLAPLDPASRPWLGGARPGLADLALAALAAPVLSPPAYCAGKCTPPPSLSPPPRWRAPRRTPERRAAVCADAKWFDLLLERDAALREETETWRATGVGRHALKVYAACRLEPLVAFDEDNFQSAGPTRAW